MGKAYDPAYPYIGVGKLKLPASHPFNYAAYLHDQAYNEWPCMDTKVIDIDFYHTCVDTVIRMYMDGEIWVGELSDYLNQAKRCYKLCRVWGKGRYFIAKMLGWKYLLRKE